MCMRLNVLIVCMCMCMCVCVVYHYTILLYMYMCVRTVLLAHRVDEKDKLADISTTGKFGARWEKIARLVDLTPKNPSAFDMSRMRSLLIRLKNEKPVQDDSKHS